MAGRKGDIAIKIYQDNKRENLFIKSIDESFAQLNDVIGYNPADLNGRSIKEIFPDRINKLIDDFLDFNNGGSDFPSVIKKTREFGLKNNNGDLVPLSVRIQSDVSLDNNLHYIMVVRDESKVATGCLKTLNEIKAKQVLDDSIGVMNNEGFMDCVNVVSSYIQQGATTASLAMISFDGFDNYIDSYGQESCSYMLKEIGTKCTNIFRKDDVVCYLGGGRFGVILLEADSENAAIPLNRLRWKVANQPLLVPENRKVSVTLSIAYKQFKNNILIMNMLGEIIEVLKANSQEINQITRLD